MKPKSISISDLSKKDIERFWSHVDRTGGEFACWPWTASRDKAGYGYCMIHGKRHKSHRVAAAISVGFVDEDYLACHHCDFTSCCNPNHIFVGTQADNMKDCRDKRRTASGERSSKSKLTYSEVEEIRSSSGSLRKLGARFGVSGVQILRIRRGDQWKITL